MILKIKKRGSKLHESLLYKYKISLNIDLLSNLEINKSPQSNLNHIAFVETLIGTHIPLI